jgi:hypothetical protein
MNAPPLASMRPNLTLSPSGLRSHELTSPAMPCGFASATGGMPYSRPPLLLIPTCGNSAITSSHPQAGRSDQSHPGSRHRSGPCCWTTSSATGKPTQRWPTATLKPHTATEDQQRHQIHTAVTYLDTPQRQPPPGPTYHQTTLTLPAQPLPESTPVDTRRTRTWMSSRAPADPSGSKPGPQFGCAYAWQTMHP